MATHACPSLPPLPCTPWYPHHPHHPPTWNSRPSTTARSPPVQSLAALPTCTLPSRTPARAHLEQQAVDHDQVAHGQLPRRHALQRSQGSGAAAGRAMSAAAGAVGRSRQGVG